MSLTLDLLSPPPAIALPREELSCHLAAQPLASPRSEGLPAGVCAIGEVLPRVLAELGVAVEQS